MTTGLAVPKSIEEIIRRFDAKEKPFNEHDVASELSKKPEG
jgi:hypothetical protein